MAGVPAWFVVGLYLLGAGLVRFIEEDFKRNGEPVRSLFLLRLEDGRVVFHREIPPGRSGQDP